MTTVREQILVKAESICTESGIIKKVARVRPTESTFKTLSNAFFPYMVLEAGAPAFLGQVREARKSFAAALVFKFNLPVSIMVYCRKQGDDIDTAFSDMYNEIFKLFFTDPSFYGLATEVKVDPEAHALLDLEPYYAFRMKVLFSYKTNSGI